MTLWSPDTCSCQIEYSDDGNATYIATHNTCDKHQAVTKSAAHLETVLAHNQNKNFVVQHLVDELFDGVFPHVIPFTCTYDRAAPIDDDPVVVEGLTQEQKDKVNAGGSFSPSAAARAGDGVPGTLSTDRGDIPVLVL